MNDAGIKKDFECFFEKKDKRLLVQNPLLVQNFKQRMTTNG